MRYNISHMLLPIIAIVILLIAWSLHLMQQATIRREFSLMLAGTLVAFSAAAMMGVYFLTSNCLTYFSQPPQYLSNKFASESIVWTFPPELEVSSRD
jgi:Co/Zn/Cd efflux system component